MIENGMNKSWKIAHANFKHIYEKLNKNYTNFSMLYEITLFLKIQANNENKIQNTDYFWMQAGLLNMKG